MTQKSITFSVIVPVYNEEQTLPEFYERIKAVMEGLSDSYEILFVNDGSQDQSETLLETFAAKDKSVKLIHFSRNFGHQMAITAGMDHAQGKAAIIIDGDLQDPPEIIPGMVVLWKQGNDVVYAKRTKRLGESILKKTTSKIFYRIINFLSNVPIPADVGDFRLIDRAVLNAMVGLRERHRYVRGLISWLGFRQIAIEYVRDKRYAGKTKFSWPKMIGFASNAVVSFSYKPLRLATYLGFLTAFGSFVYMMVVLFQRFFHHEAALGWASLIGLMLFFNGIILMMLGIMGEYIGRIFSECKHRPLYVVREKSPPQSQ